jgi:hypothetical protein
MAKITCETCDGSGEAVFSCCTGDVVHDDVMMCPVCYEHLGEETCIDCEGSGEVEEEDEEVTCNNCGSTMSLLSDNSIYACFNSECTSCYEHEEEDEF